MNLIVVTPPTAEPVSVAEFKAATHNDLDIDDVMLAGLLTSARQWCESFCRSTFVSTVYDLSYDHVPCGEIPVVRNPLVSVDSVKIRQGGTLVVVPTDQYQVQTGNAGRICLHSTAIPSQCWYGFDRLVIRYTAGYGAATDVPQCIKSAIILATKHLYYSTTVCDKKFDPMPWGVEALLSPYCLGGYN